MEGFPNEASERRRTLFAPHLETWFVRIEAGDAALSEAGEIYPSVLDGQFGTALALSTILLAATGVAVFVRISDQKESAFF